MGWDNVVISAASVIVDNSKQCVIPSRPGSQRLICVRVDRQSVTTLARQRRQKRYSKGRQQLTDVLEQSLAFCHIVARMV